MTLVKTLSRSLLATTVSLTLASTAYAQTTLSMWYHGAGNEAEESVLNQIVEDFNSTQNDWQVVVEKFPQSTYNESVTAAALSGKLPDILDVDGPVMPNWAWSGYLKPLSLDQSTLEGMLPGAIGRWKGELYSVGLWDAACALYARKSVLEKHGIRIPTLAQPWTKDEFDAALVKLQATDDFAFAFDPGLAWTGEWYAYAFGPMLQSSGGDLVDASAGQADGVINGEAAIRFGNWWQSLFTRKLAPSTSQDGADRDTGFLDGQYAIQLNGNWAARAAVEKFGDDVLFLPAVDFGQGPKIGASSWQFGMSRDAEHPEGVSAFIEFALQDKYMAAFSDSLGLAPPRKSAAAISTLYRPGGALEVFYELSAKQATLRAVTPGYLVASKEFEKAIRDITNGADVADTLDAAADAIDDDFDKNRGYQ